MIFKKMTLKKSLLASCCSKSNFFNFQKITFSLWNVTFKKSLSKKWLFVEKSHFPKSDFLQKKVTFQKVTFCGKKSLSKSNFQKKSLLKKQLSKKVTFKKSLSLSKKKKSLSKSDFWGGSPYAGHKPQIIKKWLSKKVTF